MLVRIDSDRFGLPRIGSDRFGLTAQSANAETFQWENAGKHGEMREIVGNGAVMEYRSDVREYSWEGSPRTPFLAATPATPLQPA